MTELNLPQKLLQTLENEMSPKFLATRTADGVPNVVPVTSTMPAGDVPNRLVFGNFLLRKSVRNLNTDPRIGLLAMTTDLEGWILQGDFEGWQRTGPYVDRINATDLLRYNAYTGIRNAGIIQVRQIVDAFHIKKIRVLLDYLVARASARPPSAGAIPTTEMPRPVLEQFSPMMAVRVLAFLDEEGYPTVIPALSLQPAGRRALVCAAGRASDSLAALPRGAAVAASLLTFGAVSFQAKGEWLGSTSLLGAPIGRMAVTEVFAGGPPIPGQQVA